MKARPGLIKGENTPAKNRAALRRIREEQGPGSGQRSGDTPEKKRPAGTRSFARKGD